MIILGLLLPLIGTTIGSFLVYFIKNELSNNFYKSLLAFSSGVMFASAIWSLLLPSLEINYYYSFIGFILGIVFLYLLNLYNSSNHMFFVITLHNIPEGLAVGVIFASFLFGNVTLISALLLSIGIAIQNIPEGSIISLNCKSSGKGTNWAFFSGFLSGVVEPLFSLVAILFLNFTMKLLPFCLSFASSAMIYVCIDELIPEARKDNSFGTIYFFIGFILMMFLDISFG